MMSVADKICLWINLPLNKSHHDHHLLPSENSSSSANIYLFKVSNKKHQNGVIDVVLVFLLLTLNIFHTF